MINYRQEFIDIVKDESIALITSHYNEVHPSRESFGLGMDWDLYSKLENMGMVKVFTARDDQKLVGYLWVLISPNLHSKGTKVASDDGLFVDKKYRGSSVAKGLIGFAEKCLKDDGFKTFYITGTTENPIDPLMKKLGYSPIETKFQKVL